VSSFACPGIGNVGKFDAQQTFAVRPNTIDPIKRNMADSFREYTARILHAECVDSVSDGDCKRKFGDLAG